MKPVPLQRGTPVARHGRVGRPPAGLRLRLRVRLHRASLDRQLSDGLAAGSAEDRARRARQLEDSKTRRRLASALRGVIADSELPAVSRLCSAVPVSRGAVLPWRQALLGLAERLESTDLVDPCGVARVMVLITDGCSPIYSPYAEGSMSDAIWWIADGLQASHQS